MDMNSLLASGREPPAGSRPAWGSRFFPERQGESGAEMKQKCILRYLIITIGESSNKAYIHLTLYSLEVFLLT